MTHLVPQDPTPLGCLKRWLCGFKVLAQQFAKRMGWAVPVQDFSGAVVKHLLHVFDGFAREPMEARARGKELAEQPIGVLIGAPLPRAMPVRKVDPHLRLLREEAVLAPFGGPI